MSKLMAPAIFEVRSSLTTSATDTSDSLSGFNASPETFGSFLLLSVFAMITNISYLYRTKKEFEQMCKIGNSIGYLSTLFKITTLIQLIQPNIKNKPPMGVMGPKIDRISNFINDCNANKYKDPLKQNTPIMKKFAALRIPFCTPANA